MNSHKKGMLVCSMLVLSVFGLKAGDSQSSTPSTAQRSGGGGNTTLTTSNKAYGDNLKEVEPGVFAIYSGDVNQDGYIATDDVTTVDNDNLTGASGNYLVTDLNGDTYVGTDDVTLCDNNNLMGIQIQRP